MPTTSNQQEAAQIAKIGTFLGIPYDWRPPTWAVMRERMWNPRDRRVFTPKVFGWGWSINIYEVLRRLKVVHGV